MHFAHLVLLTTTTRVEFDYYRKNPTECPLSNYGWNIDMGVPFIKPVAMQMVLSSGICCQLGILATGITCKL